MRDSKSTYTSTCDKFGKTLTSDRCYPPLRSIYLPDMRGIFLRLTVTGTLWIYAASVLTICWNLGLRSGGKEITEEAKRYRSY